MAGATPQLIKELREMTGAEMLDCKKCNLMKLVVI